MTDQEGWMRCHRTFDSLQAKRIRRALKDMMPASMWQSGRFGTAGSCALRMYQLGRAAPSYYWDWRGRNVDLFICGNDTAFFHCRRMIRQSLHCKQYKVLASSTSLYTHAGQPTFRWDFAVAGIYPSFTLRQGRERNLQEVVNKFQIDVSRVIYEVVHDRYILHPDTARGIEACRARIEPAMVDRDAPSDLEIKAICSTYNKAIKYNERGFEFPAILEILVRGTVDGSPVPSKLPVELQPVRKRYPRQCIIAEFEQILAFIQKVIPDRHLTTHSRVGIIGEYPLAYHLAKGDIERIVPRIHLWKPREVHVAFCDRFNQADRELVAQVFGVARLKELGYNVSDRNTDDTMYLRSEEMIVSTLWFRIEEIDVTFVAQRFLTGRYVRDVVGSFDAVPDRFYYDFNEARVEAVLSQGELCSIEHGDVKSRPILTLRCPDKRQVQRLEKVLRRMQKYKRQGFNFIGYPAFRNFDF